MQCQPLLDFYHPSGPERVGFVLTDGAIVEVENTSQEPNENFDVCTEDLITFGDRAVSTWHTHPGALANLSMRDNSAFLSWPGLNHFIIGSDGIREFIVEGQRVVAAAYHPSRSTAEALSRDH